MFKKWFFLYVVNSHNILEIYPHNEDKTNRISSKKPPQKSHKNYEKEREKIGKIYVATRAGYGPSENCFSGRVRAPTPIL